MEFWVDYSVFEVNSVVGELRGIEGIVYIVKIEIVGIVFF